MRPSFLSRSLALSLALLPPPRVSFSRYNGHRHPAFAIHLIDDEHVISCDGVLDMWHPETGVRILQLGQAELSATLPRSGGILAPGGIPGDGRGGDGRGGASGKEDGKAASGGVGGGGDERGGGGGGGTTGVNSAVHAALGMGGDANKAARGAGGSGEAAHRSGRFVALSKVSNVAMHAAWPHDADGAGADAKVAPPVWAPYGLVAATAAAEICTVDFRIQAGVARIGGGWRPAMPKDLRFGMLSAVVRARRVCVLFRCSVCLCCVCPVFCT